jgi:hypothetical protein
VQALYHRRYQEWSRPNPKYIALGRIRFGGRHDEDSKRPNPSAFTIPRAAEIDCDQSEGPAVRNAIARNGALRASS